MLINKNFLELDDRYCLIEKFLCSHVGKHMSCKYWHMQLPESFKGGTDSSEESMLQPTKNSDFKNASYQYSLLFTTKWLGSFLWKCQLRTFLFYNTIKKDNLAFYPLTSQSVLCVYILIFTLKEEAFINHFPKCSRTVCSNNAPHSDHCVIRFTTHPLHPPSHQLNNHLAVSIYLPASVSQLLIDFEFPLI